MFGNLRILRICSAVIWLIGLFYSLPYLTNPRTFVSTAATILAFAAVLVFTSTFKLISVLKRTAIFMLFAIGVTFFAASVQNIPLVIPIVLVLITIASATFLSKPLLIFVSAAEHIAITIFFISMQNVSSSLITSHRRFYFVYMLFCTQFFSYVFIDWANTQIKSSRQMAQKSEHASRVKSEFLANMSHEIRTPMNAIVGMTELILSSPDNSTVKEIQSKALHIKNAGTTLINLINDILEISKIEQGIVEIIESDYSVRTLAYDVVEIIKMKLADKSVALHTDIDVDAYPMLHGDSQRIKQILLNILINAVKFTEHGYVLFKLGETKTDSGVDLNITISDTGIGIKEDDLRKMFEPFQQLDLKKNKSIEGTGLGLSITKTLLSAMNGTIAVGSTYGKGTRFTLTIPQKKPLGELTARNITDDVPKRNFAIKDTEILVVDDNKVNLVVIKGLFKLYGVTVDTAQSGYIALYMLQEKQYDIIYMDHMMPEMDGVETTELIRALPNAWCKTVPIVALTANVISGMEQVCLNHGMNAFVAKPIDMLEFETTLKRFVKPENIVGLTALDIESAVLSPQIRIDGIDTSKGVMYCGGVVSAYFEVLEAYCHNAPAQIETMIASHKNGDIVRLAIEAHSLKSTSRGIGADALGELALSMETAAKAKDFEFVDKHINELLEQYSTIFHKIEEALYRLKPSAKVVDKTPISQIQLEESLAEIADAAENYDIDLAAKTLAKLKDVEVSETVEEGLREIEAAISMYDYSEIAEKARAVLARQN